MSKVCEICGKSRVIGGSITRRGLAKKKGGIGMHVVKNVHRAFRPNLQSIKIKDHGTTRTVKVCAACIRSGKIQKA